ncbi:MAG: hemolysin III family protein, partial [Firmicutes bacterium]|nr:hemolysin III family protein [Bacillota bacterium]
MGSYIPVTLGLLRGWLGWTLFGINAAVAVLGITLNAVSVRRFHKLCLVLYLLSGWSVLPAIKPVAALLDLPGFILVLAGGLFYTIGVIFYLKEEVRYM